MSGKVASISGASGLVGRHIYRKLLGEGYQVRVLSRKRSFFDSNAELFTGDIREVNVLVRFLDGADVVFHCAAELRDESTMWDVNVNGTKALLEAAARVGIKRLCFLSSAGVVGACKARWVDEGTECFPQDEYEKSKYAAEQLVAQGIEGCSVVILRPTDVISEDKPGVLTLPLKSSYMDVLKVFVKGGECAHIVHADDVADAALYFSTQHFNSPQCFFVSCDHEPLNTVAGLWALYKSYIRKRTDGKIREVPHLPLIIPYLARKIWRGTGNRGDVRYSSEKLLSEGFNYRLGVKDAVKMVALRNKKII